MTQTPVIEVPVDDSAFQRFAAAFDDYGEKLKAMPAAWGAMNGRIAELAKLQRAVGVSSDAAWASATAAAVAYEKTIHSAAKAQQHLGSTTMRTGTAMGHMAAQARSVKDHLFGAVRLLARFSALSVGGGLLGGGGLMFGMDALSGRVLATQRASRGLGLTSGQYNSFMANQKQFAGASLLAGVANAQTNPAAAVNLSVLGISPQKAQSENAARLAGQVIVAMHNLYRANPHSFQLTAQYAAIHALGGTAQDVRNSGIAHLATIRAGNAAMSRDAASMGFTRKAAHEWIEFNIALQKAGIRVESAMVGALATLTQPLGSLSRELVSFIAGLEKSGQVKVWVDDLAGSLKEFAAWVKTPAFQKGFVEVENEAAAAARALGYLAGDVISLAKWMEAHAPKSVNWKWVRDSALTGAAVGAVSAGPGGAVVGAIGGAIVGYTAQGGVKLPIVNNPLNMKDTTGSFMSFGSERQGVVQAYERMQRYPREYKTKTLADLIGTWNGHGANSAAYAAFVAHRMGMHANDAVPYGNKAKMAALIHWMSVEEGTHPVSQAAALADIASIKAKSPYLSAPGAVALHPLGGGGMADHGVPAAMHGLTRALRRPQAQQHVKVIVQSPPGSRVYVSANGASGGGGGGV